ncbi:serine/threonine-protein kinase BIK1-like [Prosopis cineraria]|uniref:serine/threonine-protein kinase BIK1-like n=1 Tax=Prosopis cineraria TaxID=364024 RepID=UPI00241022C7|nr:serine/threonine-protein kinase BIK1-like [Prosopis cineraria]
MSTYSQLSSRYEGSLGYMPPEYTDSVNVFNVKVDVYSFGFLMLEAATGRQPAIEELWLPEWAIKVVSENREMQMVHPQIIRASGVSEASVKGAAKRQAYNGSGCRFAGHTYLRLIHITHTLLSWSSFVQLIHQCSSSFAVLCVCRSSAVSPSLVRR